MQPLGALAPGMILNEAVCSPDGKIVLGRGTVLTDYWIKRLSAWGVIRVDTRAEHAASLDEDELNRILQQVLQEGEQTKSAAQVAQEKFFAVYEQVEVELQRMFLWTRCSGKLAPMPDYFRLAEIIFKAMEIPGAFLFVHSSARAETYLYRHSMDVAILSGMMGRWLGFANASVKELIVAGLLHDIGKARIHYEFLYKPAVLTSQEKTIAQQYSLLSRKLLSQAVCSEDVRVAVAQHHERMDGSGYPEGIQACDIHPYARILALMNVYDALTSDRCCKKAVTPLEAAEIIVEEMVAQFDTQILTCLVEQIRNYLLGGKVLLSDGMKGEIVLFPSLPAMRPIVKSREGEVIDLSLQRHLTITKLVVS
jgi:putative nucleotidyltransferase with HDIG domain